MILNSNVVDDDEEEIMPTKGKNKKLLVEINNEWIDARYLSRMKRVEKYSETEGKMKFGFILNPDAPEFFSLKDYEMLYDTEEAREAALKDLKAKLVGLGIEII